MSDPRYPIGKFSYTGPVTVEQKQRYLNDIEQTPARLRAAVAGLSEQQLNTPYREGGWTVRQLAHHVPDSHMNSYIRFKLALTEDNPTIKPYLEDRWARGQARSRGCLPRPARLPAPALDADAPRPHRRRLATHFPPSGNRADDAGEKPCAVLVARTPSRGARHQSAGKDGLVETSLRATSC
jgi:hypothetical protein